MKNLHQKIFRSACPINILLEMVGDAWSLLIVRDLMFNDCKTYNDFLKAGEGIATNILSDRLQKLEATGFIEKQNDSKDARRYLYRLTERGIGLAPILVEMILWSDYYENTAAPPSVIRAMKKDREGFIAKIYENWRTITNDYHANDKK